jgi:hypothetical protein
MSSFEHIYSYLLPILKLVFAIELSSLYILFCILTLFQIHGLQIYFVDCLFLIISFLVQKTFSLMQFYSSIFLFFACILGSLSKKSLPIPVITHFYWVFF